MFHKQRIFSILCCHMEEGVSAITGASAMLMYDNYVQSVGVGCVMLNRIGGIG